MGEDTCIFVNKKDLEKVGYYTAMKITNHLSGRWYHLKDKYFLSEYHDRGFFLPEEILDNIAGKEVIQDYVEIMKNLKGCDCIIQGDYMDFPKDKNQDDYVDLTIMFFELFNKLALESSDKEEGK